MNNVASGINLLEYDYKKLYRLTFKISFMYAEERHAG